MGETTSQPPRPRGRLVMKVRLRSLSGATMGAASIALMVALLSPLGAAAAQPPIRLFLYYSNPCLSGTTTLPATVSVLWRDSAGAVKAQGTSDSNGFWQFCSGSEDIVVEIGDKMRFSDGSYTRNYVVPNLRVTVDRVDNRFHGTGPAGRTIRLAYAQGLLSDFDETHSVRVGQDGTWAYDPGFNIPGGQHASLFWKSPNGDNLETGSYAPQVTVTIGESEVRGHMSELSSMRLVLLDGATGERKAVATDVSDNNGGFRAVFRDPSGHRVNVEVGDRVRGRALASDLNWIVPDSDATANVAADTVSGHCQDAGQLSDVATVDIYRTGRQRGHAFVHTDANGHFDVDFGGRATPGFEPANIKHGDRIAVRCMLETGDWVVQSFDVP